MTSKITCGTCATCLYRKETRCTFYPPVLVRGPGDTFINWQQPLVPEGMSCGQYAPIILISRGLPNMDHAFTPEDLKPIIDEVTTDE